MTKKKVAKKYDMSRQNISDALEDLRLKLGDIDTFCESPSDVADELNNITSELDELVGRVLDEA